VRIQYCSDLHLEFEENSRFLSLNPLEVTGDILILAGDIVPLHDRFLNHPFFSFASENYRQVFWVPGNHEFYYRNISDFESSFNMKVKDNILLLHNVELDIEGVHFVFSTLWSQISSSNEKQIEREIADFSYITSNNRAFQAKDFNLLHQKSLQFIKSRINDDSKKTVVVTHHLPSASCNRPAHSKSHLNEAFCVDITEEIANSKARFWIYGHSHYNQRPLFIGKTILLTNQLGYLQMNEKTEFSRGAYFSV
jgi:predicted phosphodiesterase